MSNINRNSLIIVILLSILIVVFFAYFIVPKYLVDSYLFFLILINVFSLLIFSSRFEKEKVLSGQYVRILPLFLLGFFIVHFQVYIDYLLGNYKEWYVDYFLNDAIVVKTAVISTIGNLSFLIGYLTSKVHSVKKSNNVKYYYASDGLVWVVAFFFIGFIFQIDRKFFLGNVVDVEISTLAEYFNRFLLSSIVGYVVLKVVNTKISDNEKYSFKRYLLSFNKIYLIIVLLYGVLFLMSGDRGPAFRVGLAIFCGYILISFKRFKILKTLLLIGVGAYVLALVGYIRALTDTESYFDKIILAHENMISSGKSHSISPLTVELATSVRTAHAAVNYTENNDYKYGVFQGYQIIGAIPGVGLIFNSLFDLERKDVTSSLFLTYQIKGPFPTHGMGSSAIADIYLDFGIPGVFILFLFFGSFVRNYEIKAFCHKDGRTILEVVIYITLFMNSIYIGRSTIMSLARIIIEIYLVIYFGFLVSSILYKKYRIKVN